MKAAWVLPARRLSLVLCVFVLGLFGLLGCGADDKTPEWLPGRDIWCCESEPAPAWESETLTTELAPRAKRHAEFMEAGAPLEYRSQINPYPSTTEIIHDGGQLFHAHCAGCHGKKGMGDGEASKDLTPSPALLSYMIERPRSVDEYLLWTISEGGAAFSTAMPAFKEILTEQQIWQIVVYMRDGFPPIQELGE